jgi:RND family efflux transporter MFP subunit
MKIFIAVTVLVFFALVSCTEERAVAEVEVKPVGTSIATSVTKAIHARNIGTVISSDIKKLGFKIPGKIENIGVKRGDRIKRGTLLARLETKELNFALDAAQNTLRKAEDYYNETASFYSRIKGLYDMEAVPQSDHDKAKLAMDVAKSDLENARVDVEYKRNMLKDAVLTADIDGFVIEVLNKRGEIVPAGYPVVVIRNESMIVRTGVPVKDLRNIRIGTETSIEIDGSFFEGKVTNIAQIPDERSRTYAVEVDIHDSRNKKELFLGSIAKVDFNIGEKKGIWVPVFSLLTDGTDYVYTFKNGIALRKNIKTGHVSGEFVLVEGLSEGDKVVIEGMKDINDGDRIKEK